MTDKEIIKTEYLYDKHGYSRFKIDIEAPGEYQETSFNAKVYEITSWEPNTHEPLDPEMYLSCYIKWDSCSHVWFGDLSEDGSHSSYLHLCGPEYFQYHIDLLNYLYHLAFREMGKEPFDNRDVWPLNLQLLSTEAAGLEGENI